MNIRNSGACALATLFLLTACGSDPAADAAANAADANARNEMQAMANAADGSAAKAVGDMMSDPAIQDQLGMSTGPARPTTPAPATGVPTAAAPGADMTVVDPNSPVDPSQVRALAMCHGLKAARTGTPYPMGPEADAKATAELRADPNALNACQAG